MSAARPRPRSGGAPASRWWPLWLPLALAIAGLALATWSLLPRGPSDAGAGETGTGDAEAVADALVRGNRLARRGDADAAVAAYAAGWPERALPGTATGDAAADLAYNLGTTLHRRGERADALLWYRRAAELVPGDPWLADNLELVRAELAAARHPAPGVAGRLAERPEAAPIAATVLAWAALALYLLRAPLERRLGPAGIGLGGRLARHAWLVAAALALAVWAAGVAFAAWGPRPAVLLAPCSGAGGRLPAGSEVWVAPGGEAGWAVRGGPPGLVCPPAAVGLLGGR